jgi:hypothetical protein
MSLLLLIVVVVAPCSAAVCSLCDDVGRPIELANGADDRIDSIVSFINGSTRLTLPW